MKKSATEIIKTRLNKLLEESKLQRLQLIDILKIFKDKINKDVHLFEELVYLIEKQNEEYEILISIKDTKINNKDIAIQIMEELNSMETITNLLKNCLKVYLELTFISTIDNKYFSLLNSNSKKEVLKDEYYAILIQKKNTIKYTINNNYKSLKKKTGRRK